MKTDSSKGGILVIGATGGTGAAVVRMLRGAGRHVLAAGRDEERLGALSRDGFDTIRIDATRLEEVEAGVSHVVERHGRIDAAINLAGSLHLKPAHLTSTADFQRTLDANLLTSFHVVRSAVRPMMTDGGGAIVLVSSAAARVGLPNHEAIAAAKAGVDGLVRSAAATYGHRDIRVNAVAPGLVDTPLARRITASESGLNQSKAMHALGRIGQPDDVARVVVFLADRSRSGWITGQTFGVDGGLSSVRARQ